MGFTKAISVLCLVVGTALGHVRAEGPVISESGESASEKILTGDRPLVEVKALGYLESDLEALKAPAAPESIQIEPVNHRQSFMNRLLVGLRFLMVTGVVTTSFVIQFDAPVASALVPGVVGGALSAAIQNYNVEFNEWLNRKGVLKLSDLREGSPHEKVIKYYTTALAYILMVQFASVLPGVELRDLSVSFFTHAALTAVVTFGQGFWDIWNATRMDRALKVATTAKEKSVIAIKSGVLALVISAVATAGDAFAAFGELGAYAFMGALGFSGWLVYERTCQGPAHKCLIRVRDKLRESEFSLSQLFRQNPVTTCRQILSGVRSLRTQTADGT